MERETVQPDLEWHTTQNGNTYCNNAGTSIPAPAMAPGADGAGLPEWPAYSKANGYPVMHLSANSHFEADQRRARYGFLDGLRR